LDKKWKAESHSQETERSMSSSSSMERRIDLKRLIANDAVIHDDPRPRSLALSPSPYLVHRSNLNYL
jgi:hypothetical protein